MATQTVAIMGGVSHVPDDGTYPNLIGNEISSTATPSAKDVGGLVVNAASTSDIGFKDAFKIPAIYASSGTIIVTGILDGAPASTAILGFGFREKAIANNEGSTGAFASEQIASTTIGSGGTNHSNNDLYIETIALSGTYAAGDWVPYHAFMDASVTSYAGNFIWTELEFQFSDT